MHRSGITVTEGLKQEFAAAQKAADTLYFRVKIDADTFKKVDTGPAKADGAANFAALQATLKSGEPSFIITRAGQKDGKWLFLFYVPEDSTPKEKMTYASSSAALKDGLGAASFSGDYSISTKNECTYDAWLHHTKEYAAEDILTIDELNKREEQLQSGMAAGASKTAAIADVAITVAEDAAEALKVLGGAGGQVDTVVLALEPSTQVLKLDSKSKVSIEDLGKKLPAKEPRFALHRFAHDYESKQSSAIVFVYYCPDVSAPRSKMMYSTCKSNAVKYCEKIGIVITKQYECSELSELTTAALMNELYPKIVEKKVVAKPKKPGKGPARLASGVKFSAKAT
jgi:hypothetical protein